MNSSIDDGGLEFRGTDATLKINRSGFEVFRERVDEEKNPAVTAAACSTGRSRMWRIFSTA